MIFLHIRYQRTTNFYEKYYNCDEDYQCDYYHAKSFGINTLRGTVRIKGVYMRQITLFYKSIVYA